MPIKTSTSLAALLVLALSPGIAHAQQRATPSLSVTALNTTAAREVATLSGSVARTTVQPGDVLRYALTFTNSAPTAVRNVELRDPMPAGMHFVSGSAHASRADARLEFSADGGRSWAAQPVETVFVDGRQVIRPVSAGRYTHVRWVVGGAVAPGAVVTADFEARVGGAGA